LNITDRHYKFTFHGKDGKYYYTKELDGAVKFIGEDFEFISQLDENGYGCSSITFEVYRDFPSYSVLEYVGKVRLVDLKYDLDKCIIEAEIKPLTPYDCIEVKGDTDINVLDLQLPKRDINFIIGDIETFDAPTPYTLTNKYIIVTGPPYIVYANYEDTAEALFWTAGGQPPVQTGWRWYYLEEVTQPGMGPGSTDLQTGYCKWVREVITISALDYPPAGFILVDDLGASKKYARPVILYERKTTEEKYYVGPNPEYLLKIDYKYTGMTANNSIMRQALKFGEVIEAMLQSMCAGSPELVSDFLQYKPINQSGLNYVTGQINNLSNLYLIQKSDAKKPDASQISSNGNSKFNDFMKSIQALFDARYYFDASGNFRIEHISYFNKIVELDLTTIDGGKWCIGQRKYTYDLNNMPRTEKFKCMEQAHIDFVGKDIEYDESCTQEKTETYSASNITTDIMYVLNEPDKIADDGWVLIACAEYNGKLYILQEPGIFHPKPRPNNILSFAHLHRDFYRHNRVKKKGYLNGNPIVFDSVRPTKKAESISIPFPDITQFKPDQLVNGVFGNGVVMEAKYSLKSEMLDITLLHDKAEPATSPTGLVYVRLTVGETQTIPDETIHFYKFDSNWQWVQSSDYYTLANRKGAVYKVEFFSDPTGAIPLSVTNFPIKIKGVPTNTISVNMPQTITTAVFNGTVGYFNNFIDTSAPGLTGIEFEVINHFPYLDGGYEVLPDGTYYDEWSIEPDSAYTIL